MLHDAAWSTLPYARRNEIPIVPDLLAALPPPIIPVSHESWQTSAAHQQHAVTEGKTAQELMVETYALQQEIYILKALLKLQSLSLRRIVDEHGSASIKQSFTLHHCSSE